MEFDPTQYVPQVARLLTMADHGDRLFPLRPGECLNPELRDVLRTLNPRDLFPDVEEPEAPMTGLFLYFSCFEEAHKLADFCESHEGELWHAILHRREPDSGNAAYWFRRVGSHPVFDLLPREVKKITSRFREAEFRGHNWDPFAFVSFCDRARRQPGSVQEQAAMEIQRVEWQLLFDYSSRQTD
jgi:hypothetical protein